MTGPEMPAEGSSKRRAMRAAQAVATAPPALIVNALVLLSASASPNGKLTLPAAYAVAQQGELQAEEVRNHSSP